MKHFEPLNEREKDLRDAVAFLMANVPERKADRKDIDEKAVRIHREYIQGYYRQKAEDFRKNPYYR